MICLGCKRVIVPRCTHRPRCLMKVTGASNSWHKRCWK